MDNSELQETLQSYLPILEEGSLNAIVKYSSYLKCTKGTKLISEGKRHRYIYLIIKGSVKSYYLKDSKEVCMWFSLENEIIVVVLPWKLFLQTIISASFFLIFFTS